MVSAIVGLRRRGINRISESLTVGQLPLVASLSGQRGIGVRLRPSVGCARRLGPPGSDLQRWDSVMISDAGPPE
jgi:hypothetical protein